MGRYPDLRPALPTNFVNSTTTARFLTPAIVFTALLILLATSIAGLAIPGAIFARGTHGGGVKAAQVFFLLASLVTLVYIGFHLTAAFYNEPVGVIRPPVVKVHANCFIVARVALLAWIAAMIAALIVISRSSVCRAGERDCRLQLVGVIGSTLAFLSTGTILTALESCHCPFQMPEALNHRLITCRVSAFGDDMEALDRSVSQVSFYRDDNVYVTRAQDTPSIKRKAVAEKSTPVPGEWPEERPITPLLPMMHRSSSRGWGDEWTHVEDNQTPKRKAVNKSDSAISISTSDTSSGYAKSSTGYRRSSSGYASISDPGSSNAQRRQSRPRTVTPSSSISNLSRRSPLSTMRSAEFPEVAIRPELRYFSPNIPPPHEWSLSRTASLSQLLPVADIYLYTLQRRTSNTMAPLRGPIRDLMPIPGSPTIRRKSVKLRIPGAYVDEYQERILDNHMRKIEVSSIIRSQCQVDRKPLGSILQGADLEKFYAPSSFDKYREQILMQDYMPNGPQNNVENRPDSSAVMEAMKVGYVKGGPLRRLSLGDISGTFGKMWEV